MPENLQPLCFELLLRDYLEGRQRLPAAPPSSPSPPPPAEQSQAQDSIAASETSTGQQDLRAGDLHVKVRKFTVRHGHHADSRRTLRPCLDPPVEMLAGELGLSGRGLGKMCARYHIPVPPLGYCAKKAAGKRVGRPKLADTESYQQKMHFAGFAKAERADTERRPSLDSV